MRKRKAIHKPTKFGARLTPVAYENLTAAAADYKGNRSKALTAILEQLPVRKTKDLVQTGQVAHQVFQG